MRHLILLLFLSVSWSIRAQKTDSLDLEIEEIIITENRISLPFSDVSRSIEIIDNQQIKKISATSLNEVIQLLGGVDLRQRGINGVQADLSIRGGTFEQALVLINGVKMIDPQTGHHLMNLPITIEDVERIEVLKGPGARVFGQNAFTGAINIITKTSIQKKATAGVSYGENGLLGIFASADLPIDNYQQKISVSYDYSDGYRDNTDYNIANLFYQGHTKIGLGQLDILGGYTFRNFGANGFYGNESFVDQYERTRTSFVSGAYTIEKSEWKVKSRLSWRRNFDNWRFRRFEPDFFQNIHTSHVVTADINTTKTHKAGILGIGVEYNYITLASSNLGDHNRNQLGLHLENRFLLFDDKIDITPGVFVQSISDYDTKVYPGIDMGFLINNRWKVFGNIGSTSRIPSFTDLYYEDRGNLGNPNLTDESAITFEIGGKFKSRNLFFQFSFFRREATDLIDWFKVNPEDRWTPDNFGSARYNGIDINLTSDLSGGKETKFLQYLRFNYLFLDAKINSSDVNISRNARENLRHQLIVNPQFRISEKLNFHIVFKYNDRVSLEDYVTTDFNIQYAYSNLLFNVKANNLFDISFRETNLVPMPGRWISGGVRVRI